MVVEVVEVVEMVESEPGLVGRGRVSEWDRDLGRVRLGYDMVRIRVRWRERGRYCDGGRYLT
jgi:hypothetical protein